MESNNTGRTAVIYRKVLQVRLGSVYTHLACPVELQYEREIITNPAVYIARA